MSDCANSSLQPYKRIDVYIVFDDWRELEYHLPLNLMNRNISHFVVDGVRYVRQRRHVESCEVREIDG